ncbi:alpha/beta hydrolase [Candidatus Bipolaricaulota bacterium]|jgi:haloalkane dehalogenase|nr:alpha/beta hydrolase [Candidatus Bipolaricaulota bacterium]TFH11637.1 MAG: alpha/beta hydrolase [Candidatus Atribacteria bacterium]
MKSFYVESLNAHLFYHDLPGDGPVLVMLHGLGSSSSSWYPPAAHHVSLRNHRCLLVDFLGYGYSDRPRDYDYAMESQADTVAKLLDHLCLTDCIVVGHSMGGSIAILLADARPDLVSHLIVAEGNLDPGPGFVSGRIVTVSEQVFATSKFYDFCQQMRETGYHDYASTLRASEPVALYRSAVSLIADRSPSYRERFYNATMPRTFIFGERTLPDPDEKVLVENGIDVHIVPMASHDMMGDNPQGFAEAIVEGIIQAS